MACVVAVFALFSPRLALVALWVFGDLLSRAFESWVVPLLGFFLLPWTTLAYAVMWSSADRVSGLEWFLVVLAFGADIGAYGGGRRARRSR
jgi:CDP-diglyceride synthetase